MAVEVVADMAAAEEAVAMAAVAAATAMADGATRRILLLLPRCGSLRPARRGPTAAFQSIRRDRIAPAALRV
jgi:hypothetical protein